MAFSHSIIKKIIGGLEKMKKLVFSALLVVLCISLFAQITATPYGSARVGYWLENYDEDLSKYEDAYMDARYFLQSNSRFGVNFKDENFDAKIEFGAAPSLRLLWARQKFGSWSLLVGQEEVVPFLKTNQVWDSDKNTLDYGAVDGGRRMQVKFEMDNGFYLALVDPNVQYGQDEKDYIGPTVHDKMVPMINVGYNWKSEKFSIHPTFVFQTFSFSDIKNPEKKVKHKYEWKVFNPDSLDVYHPILTEEREVEYMSQEALDTSIVSWMGALTAEYNADPILVRASFNYGTNTGNMGFQGPNPSMMWNWIQKEIVVQQADTLNAAETVKVTTNEVDIYDTTTLGGWLTVQYTMNPTVNFTAGFGYAASSNEMFKDKDKDNKEVSDTAMAVFLQSQIKINRFRLLPEVGLMDKMDSKAGEKEGSLMYFGTQLRLDF